MMRQAREHDMNGEEREDAAVERPPDEAEIEQEEQFLEELLEPKDELQIEAAELVRYDPLKRYLLEISRFAPLTREEEHRLAVLYQETGSREAVYRLVTSNLKLVVKIAMIYNKVYSNLMDLIQEGNIGLLQAVKRFDPFRGTRLPTYAAWWIKAYIIKFILDNSRMVKIGTTNARRKVLMNLDREKRALEARGITPTPQLIAESLGVGEADVIDVERGMSSRDISLDAPIAGGDGESDLVYLDTLQRVEASIDDKIAQGEFQELIEQKFQEFASTLSEREQVILKQRLIAEEPRTLQQIADRYGITREAVRVAEKKLVAKLKQYMTESFKDVREIEFNLGT
jgi:RNA polymerase sigma-32 factor